MNDPERDRKLNKFREQIKKMLRDRTHTRCDHCERQYDDSTCDQCFANKIVKAMLEIGL